MKKPIAWHRECLQNATDTLARAEAALAEQQVSVSRIKTSVELSIRQLAEAERLGITEFDPDTFLVPRKPRIKEMIPEAIKVAVAEYDGWVPNDMGYWHRNGEVAGLVAQCCDDCDDIGFVVHAGASGLHFGPERYRFSYCAPRHGHAGTLSGTVAPGNRKSDRCNSDRAL